VSNRIGRQLGVCLTIAMALVLGCDPPGPATAPADAPGGVYAHPAGTGPQTIEGIDYAYIASATRETQIRTAYASLTVGQTREDVRRALGAPDLAFPRYTSNEEGHRYLGWGYLYLLRDTPHRSSTADVNILMVFDPSTNRLAWTSPSDSAKLPHLGTEGSPR
jgi:hypothetical protein